MSCPACGGGNRDGARFCAHCGEALPSACASCGRALPPDARFCDACGAAVAETRAAPRRPDAPARAPRDYTPKHLVEKILRSKSALEGERKHVTVLFADVKESMDLAEQVGAESWHRILDRFFEILSAGVHRYEGTVNQYTGDGIMALFGAPLAHEDHAHRACYAALWLRDELRGYTDELRRDHGLSFSVRIGLNSGDVVVGRIGDDLRMDYTAQGATVGLAQRMEQLAAADSAYLTQHTAELVRGFFALRDLGAFAIKGVAAPLSVYELEGLGALRTRLDLSRARGFSRFVGRRDELATLDAALERAIAGRGGAVGVVADAGVGKSRLCLEFVERCRARGIAVFEAHCPAHGRLLPLLPLHELLRSFFGIADNDSPQATREKIAGRMLLLDRDFDAELPLAFELLGVPDPATPRGEADATQRQRRITTLLRRLLKARSAREPAVLFVDDMHWIDASSDEYVADIADTIVNTRTLLLANFRPEYTASWMSDPSYQQLPLLPLAGAAMDDLLDHLLGDDPSTRPLRPTIRERSGGNPFYVEEIVQSLVEEGRLVGERGAYRLVGAPDALRVPASVQAILAARIDRLGDDEKEVLQTAAAIGRRFPDGLLRRVVPAAGDAYDAAIASLRRAEMIHEETLYPEIEYAFRHPLVHEVAGASQLSDARAAVHARIAAALEESAGDRSDEQAALVAHHWDAADRAEPAARWHRRAALHIGGSNSRAAQRHWERVRSLSSDVDDERLARELGEQSRLMILEYGWRLGISPDEANALLEEGEAWARANDDVHALAAIYNAFAIPCAFSLGDVPRAVAIAREGLRLAEEVGDKPLAFALELRVFFTTEPIGDASASLRAIEAANGRPPDVMDAASPIVGYDARATAVGFRGWVHYQAGRLREGLDAVRAGLAIARANGSQEVFGWLRGLEGAVLHALGEPGIAVARESYAIAEEVDSDLSRTIAAQFLVPMLLDGGEVDAANAMLDAVLPLAEVGTKHSLPTVLSLVAIARAARGELDDARRAAADALDRARRGRLPGGELDARIALAAIELAAGPDASLARAGAELDRADEIAARLGQRTRRADVVAARVRLAERRGDAAGRDAALADLAALFRELGATARAEETEARRR